MTAEPVEFEFGMVIGMDFVPAMRLMMVAPVVGIKGIRGAPGNWWAAVLTDASSGWDPGQLISVNPLNKGITIIDTSEGIE